MVRLFGFLLAAWLMPVTASAVTIDFDDIGLMDGDLLDAPIDRVTFSLASGDDPIIVASSSAQTSPNSVGNGRRGVVTASDLVFTFASAVRDLSFYLSQETGDITVRLDFLAGGFDEEFLPFDGNRFGQEFFDFGGISGISKVTISSSVADNNYLVDTIAFTPVPLPPGILLLAGGLAALGFVRRTSRAAT
ncbi:MAG: hypothetical protein AAGF74_07300 [Pseudomonadota bacterium]